MRLPKPCIIHGILFLLSAGLLGAAFFFEYEKGLMPCPLCISQRFVFGAIGLSSLVAILLRPKAMGLKIFGGATFIFSLLGLLLVSRQIYLEYLPSSEPKVCFPGIEYLMQMMSWHDVLKSMFVGTPECGEVKWVFLGFSMATWLLPVFLFTAIVGVIEIIRKHKVCK